MLDFQICQRRVLWLREGRIQRHVQSSRSVLLQSRYCSGQPWPSYQRLQQRSLSDSSNVLQLHGRQAHGMGYENFRVVSELHGVLKLNLFYSILFYTHDGRWRSLAHIYTTTPTTTPPLLVRSPYSTKREPQTKRAMLTTYRLGDGTFSTTMHI